MNAGLESGHASIKYYDGDYPAEEHSRFPENFDETTVSQGLRHDVRRYKEIASQTGGPILELCCGTGRVALPLAKQGLEVVGVRWLMHHSSGPEFEFRWTVIAREQGGDLFATCLKL